MDRPTLKEEFKVTTNYMGGFNISIGVGKKFHAKNLDEVHIAMEHYFSVGVHYIQHKAAADKCPLCRE